MSSELDHGIQFLNGIWHSFEAATNYLLSYHRKCGRELADRVSERDQLHEMSLQKKAKFEKLKEEYHRMQLQRSKIARVVPKEDFPSTSNHSFSITGSTSSLTNQAVITRRSRSATMNPTTEVPHLNLETAERKKGSWWKSCKREKVVDAEDSEQPHRQTKRARRDDEDFGSASYETEGDGENPWPEDDPHGDSAFFRMAGTGM